MRRATLPLLVVLVAGLYFLTRERAREAKELEATRYDAALFPGIDTAAITGMRIDHVTRAVQVKLERDHRGTWFLTEPIAYPAEAGSMRHVLEILGSARGFFEPDPDPEALGLVPPEIVLEVSASTDGGLLKRRIEIGSIDVDSSRVFARIPDHPDAAPGADALVLRIPRPLYTALDRNDNDYRDPTLCRLAPDRLVSISRSGRVAVEEGPLDLDFRADLSPAGWRREEAPRQSWHPQAIGLMARAITDLNSHTFPADAPPTYVPFGLDAPLFEVSATDSRGDSVTFAFGCAPTDKERDFLDRRWYVRRDDEAMVWEVKARAARILAQPASLFVDDQILRARREDVIRFELTSGDRSLVFVHEDDRWWVSSAVGERFAADAGAVEDLVAGFEKARIADATRGTSFAAGDVQRALSITTRDGVQWGGELGASATSADGKVEGLLYRRFGDDVPGVLPAEWEALLEQSLDDVRARDVLVLPEREVRSVTVSKDGEKAHFVHEGEHWFRDGSEERVPNRVAILLDELFHLRAAEWLPVGEDPTPLEGAVEVGVGTVGGERHGYYLGRNQAGELEARSTNAATSASRARIDEVEGARRLDGARALFE